MTQREAECLDFIRKRIEQTGITPSYREIGEGVGIKSVGLISSIIHRLLAAGMLERQGKGRKRSLRLPGVELKAVPTAALVAEVERRMAA